MAPRHASAKTARQTSAKSPRAPAETRAPGKALSLTAPAEIPLRISELLAGPPILPSEDGAAYLAILDWVATSIAPEDFAEGLWAMGIAEAVWAGERLKRLRLDFIEKARNGALLQLMTQVAHPRREDGISAASVAKEAFDRLIKEPDGHARITAWLKEHGGDDAHLLAETYSKHFPTITKFDTAIESEARKRDVLIRQLERRRVARRDFASHRSRVVDAQAKSERSPAIIEHDDDE